MPQTTSLKTNTKLGKKQEHAMTKNINCKYVDSRINLKQDMEKQRTSRGEENKAKT